MSIGSDIDISTGSAEMAAPAAAGIMATEKEIQTARIARITTIRTNYQVICVQRQPASNSEAATARPIVRVD